MAEKFGMMNEAYFVGRQVLLRWVNDVCDTNIVKVEQIATGCIPAQVVDSVYPGNVQMRKLDWGAKYEYDWVSNWKVVQIAFKKIGIEKHIPVDSLVKARSLDNLEFLQWLYQWYQRAAGETPPEYDAQKRRNLSRTGKTYQYNRTGGAKPRSKPRPRPGTARSSARPSSSSKSSSAGAAGKRKPGRTAVARSQASPTSAGARVSKATKAATGASASRVRELKEEKEQLEKQVDELTLVASDLEKERDFYFSKIMEIENHAKAQADQDSEFLKKLYKILYQEDDDGTASSKSPVSQSSVTPENVKSGDELLTDDDLLKMEDVQDDGLLEEEDAEMY